MKNSMRSWAVIAALCGMTALLGACGKKVTQPPASYTGPEGHQDGSIQLMGWQDLPQIEYSEILPTAGSRLEEGRLQRDSLRFHYAAQPNQREPLTNDPGLNLTHLMVLDRSNANGLLEYRTNGSEAAELVLDANLHPTYRSVGSHEDLYDFLSAPPAPNTSFLMRGTFSGLATRDSPLSNTTLPYGGTDSTIDFLAPLLQKDSVLVVRFNQAPGAVKYFIQLLDGSDFVGSLDATRLLSPLRMILRPSKYPNYGFVAASTLSDPAEIHVLGIHKVWPTSIIVRVCAVDAGGRFFSRMNRYVEVPQTPTQRRLLPTGGSLVYLDPFDKVKTLPAASQPPRSFSQVEMTSLLTRIAAGASVPRNPMGPAVAPRPATLAPAQGIASAAAPARFASLRLTPPGRPRRIP